MTPYLIPADQDPIQRKRSTRITIDFDGKKLVGEKGQTIAAVLMSHNILTWRTTSFNAKKRGLFCGIGVCFDCILTVNGQRDVRACQRRCQDGDVLNAQHDELPEVKNNGK